MNYVPEDKTLYRMLEEQSREVLPKSLMPYFEEDIHDLVDGVKDVINLILERDPDANYDLKKQVSYKLEVWRNTKEKHIEYENYLAFIENNKLRDKFLDFQTFVDKHYYPKWQRIEALGIKKGAKIRVKGFGDLYTVKGISAHLSVAVEELSDKHFNPDQIVAVVE